MLIYLKGYWSIRGWLTNPPKLKQSQINGEIQEVQITVVAQIYGEIQHTSGAKFTEKSKKYQNTVEAQKLQYLPNYQRSQINGKSKKYQITVEAQKYKKRSKITKLPKELKSQRYPVG